MKNINLLYTYRHNNIIRIMKPTDIKLTLKLKQKSIEKAKAYAKSHQESLSRLVERYFDSVSEPPATYETQITPLIKELSASRP